MDRKILVSILSKYNRHAVCAEYYRIRRFFVDTVDEYNSMSRNYERHVNICNGLEIAMGFFPDDSYSYRQRVLYYRGLQLTVKNCFENKEYIDISI